ncbi:uncharacterized protein FMAN_03929 [Fusarium mangiferae]|uniref:Fungal N-terminal domain-containing protein n=1 Tax=Fusarium mangiferae TaxID=192010 RepID=A0A1L7U5W9_FUSMA|nr:uncharacterized protein FMAN_03929 [Fusarium mangiferae]CVL06084.1 uncharacterized protein FMAN_03929 [Fusarium mangiferae]
MAELALAVIPLGLKTCSGLVSYLGGLKDHDDAIARLKRLAESLEGSFRLLDGLLKSGQLNFSTSQAVAQTLRCLGNCEDALNDLKSFGDKISATTTPDPKLGDKVKGSYRKIVYPLRQAQLAQLENTLESLCTPLNLAVQSLQLELQATISNTLNLNTTTLQKTSDDVLAVAADVSGLRDPMSSIETKFPSLQASVDGIAPQISMMIQAQFKCQMDEIRHSFQQAESSSLRRNTQTNEILSRLQIDRRNPVPAIYKLAVKPSALSTVTSSVLACSCPTRRFRTRKTLRLGPLYFIDETMTDFAHYNDCQFGFVDHKYSRNRTVRLSSIVRLVNKAVELTLRTTGGAGGFSISPSFTYFAEVDENRSPAFRVLNLWRRNVLATEWAMTNCPEFFFKSIISKLQAIFSSGTARPTDLSSHGSSLLHVLCFAMQYSLPPDQSWDQKQLVYTKAKPLFEFLIKAGTPLSAVNSEGSMAWHIVADYWVLPVTIITDLHVEDVEVASVTRREFFTLRLRPKYSMKYFDWNQKFFESLFGPLTLAILRTDIEEAKQLINNRPECLDEISFYKQTPLHFAIENPEILEHLVQKASPGQLVRSSIAFDEKITPLGRAIWLSADICYAQKEKSRTFCPCTTAVETILAADCPIIPYRDFTISTVPYLNGFSNVFRRASKHCKHLLAKQLQSYRRELEQIAQKKLPRSVHRVHNSWVSDTSVKAIEWDRILRERGLLDFGRLSTALPDDLKRLPPGKYHSRPIYLDINNPEDASIFWDLGFSDIDDQWADWALTHEAGPGIGKSFRRFLETVRPAYAMWLHEHCPNLWSLVCEHRKLESPVFVLAEVILGLCDIDDIGCEEMVQYLINSPIVIEDTDDCVCPCSPQGCTPFTHGVKLMAAFHHGHEFLRLFISKYGQILSLSQHIAVLRQATFQKLGMEHTCIHKPDHVECGSSESDFDTLTKDSEKEMYLEKLVMEYQAFLLRDADDSPDEAGEDCKDSNVEVSTRRYWRAMEYWDSIWPLRVQEIEQELASSWNPDQEVLKNLGVSLWLEDEGETEEWSESSNEDLFRKMMDELEMIE